MKHPSEELTSVETAPTFEGLVIRATAMKEMLDSPKIPGVLSEVVTGYLKENNQGAFQTGVACEAYDDEGWHELAEEHLAWELVSQAGSPRINELNRPNVTSDNLAEVAHRFEAARQTLDALTKK